MPITRGTRVVIMLESKGAIPGDEGKVASRKNGWLRVTLDRNHKTVSVRNEVTRIGIKVTAANFKPEQQIDTHIKAQTPRGLVTTAKIMEDNRLQQELEQALEVYEGWADYEMGASLILLPTIEYSDQLGAARDVVTECMEACQSIVYWKIDLQQRGEAALARIMARREIEEEIEMIRATK